MDGPGRSRPMGGNTHRNDARRFRRRRRGVATVIGALLVLLIALVAFTVLFAEAVPTWMAENETTLAEQAQTSFAQLQATVDLQDAFGSPETGLTAVALTSSSVPVLAAPTQGSLVFEAGSTPSFINVTTDGGPGGVPPYSHNASLGELSVDLPNRYVAPQTLWFESGAVFLQGPSSDPQLLYAPLFGLTEDGGNLSLTFTVVTMVGPSEATSSPGTQQIVDTIQGTSGHSSHGAPRAGGSYAPSSIEVEVGSPDACAWSSFFAGAILTANVPSANYSLATPSACASDLPGFGVVTLSIDSVTFASVGWLTIAVGLEAGSA